MRDQVTALLAERGAEPVRAEGGYTLPFPVLSAVDAAALAVVLEDGVAAAWVRVLDQVRRSGRTRELAVGRARRRRGAGPSPGGRAAGQTPVTSAFPGLPADLTAGGRSPQPRAPRKASVTPTATLLDCPPSTRTAKAMSPCGPGRAGSP